MLSHAELFLREGKCTPKDNAMALSIKHRWTVCMYSSHAMVQWLILDSSSSVEEPALSAPHKYLVMVIKSATASVVARVLCWYYSTYYTIHTILYNLVYYTTLFYTILFYSILYCTILHYSTLYYTILYYTILYYTIIHYTILYYTILYYGMV